MISTVYPDLLEPESLDESRHIITITLVTVELGRRVPMLGFLV
jgi:hypothetical protein